MANNIDENEVRELDSVTVACCYCFLEQKQNFLRKFIFFPATTRA